MKTILFATALMITAPAAFGDAAENYSNHCQFCHGADGDGQTAMGKRLKLKDYTTAEGQKWSDSEGVTAILDGKEKMRGYKNKGITEADAKDLVKLIRAFKN